MATKRFMPLASKNLFKKHILSTTKLSTFHHRRTSTYLEGVLLNHTLSLPLVRWEQWSHASGILKSFSRSFPHGPTTIENASVNLQNRAAPRFLSQETPQTPSSCRSLRDSTPPGSISLCNVVISFAHLIRPAFVKSTISMNLSASSQVSSWTNT